MLLNDFFEITESDFKPDKLIAVIKLNGEHQIYKGHFPSNPVTPGVVQMQIVKEILENFYQKDLKLISMSRCKFLRILSPVETPVLSITIEITGSDDLIKIFAAGQNKEHTFFKLNAVYQQ